MKFKTEVRWGQYLGCDKEISQILLSFSEIEVFRRQRQKTKTKTEDEDKRRNVFRGVIYPWCPGQIEEPHPRPLSHLRPLFMYFIIESFR